MIARYFFDNDTSVLATLSGSLITITANRNSLTLTGTTSNYVANFMQAFTVGANPNTGPVRVTVDGVGPISLRDNSGISLSSSVLISGARALIVKDGTNDYFRLLWPERIGASETVQGIAELATQTETNTGTDDARIVTPLKLQSKPGQVIQIVSTQTGAVNTGIVTIPQDDTIPQITEGDQYMTLAITPKSATNNLLIEVVAQLTSSATGAMTAALFQDATAGALACITSAISNAGTVEAINFTHVMVSGTTSATTFRVRAGQGGAATTTFNGSAGARIHGGVIASSIRITEYVP